ncbi:MAG: helix-turn-helix transcriptional regulator [Oscillospiraceae bacterium]|jgi:transcriptional regulator with XRE-family HTH domain|nr:helix-turn-helix transcriptional regulator [Oscillospiraceae bacterium]MCI8941933.1 helix-turn-helix transcriptional regulator [Oscillospiraceae bacterium]
MKHILHSGYRRCSILFQPQLDPIIVGRVIAKFRVKKGMTQEVLSGFADIARGHLAMIERGERKPTLETLYRISCALEVKMSAIIMDIEKELEQKD